MDTSIVERFRSVYGKAPVALARAPGRLEVLGNHTDYNEGLVLSAAVEQATEFAIAPIKGTKCFLRDLRDGSSSEFDLNDIDQPIPGDWGNYVKGVIVGLRQRGIEIKAFEGAILSDIPLSAGMSSSAALEISAAYAFSVVFGIDLPRIEWAKVGRSAENSYIGVKTGLLDQFSSIFGKKDSLIYCDFRKVAVEKTVSLPSGFVLVVANSMVKHNLVNSDYNRRFNSCKRSVEDLKRKYPDIIALRDVTTGMLHAAKKLMSPRDYLRAKHIVGENQRVMDGVLALDNGDIEKFGKILYASHASSRENFENSCPELDCLVDFSTSIPGCVGARLSGGGFGGISIHLVKKYNAKHYCKRLKATFKQRTGKATETIICAVGDGAWVKRL